MKKKAINLGMALVMVLLEISAVPSVAYATMTVPSDALNYGGHYYYLYKLSNAISWTDAKKKCEEVGGHLATITSEKENNKIYEYITSLSCYTAWIGLYNGGTNDDAVWIWCNGEDYSYQNWNSGEPSRGYSHTENYVGYFYKGKGWNDFRDNSGEVSAYLCEWDYDILVSESRIILDQGDSTTIDAVVKKVGVTVSNPEISYKSNKTSVAKVSSQGKIIAMSPGVCKITLKYEGATKSITVIVNANKSSGVNTVSKTRNSVTISWKAQKGVSGYQVWMYDSDLEEYVNVKNVSGDFSKATISGLKKGTTYKFMVRAYVKSGSTKYYGEYSNVYKTKTK